MQGAKEAIGNITDNQSPPPKKSISKIVDFLIGGEHTGI